MRIGVVESGRLAGLHQRTAGRQLPDQDRSSVHPSRCGAGTQQALQIHQLLARQFGKSDDVAHPNRVALRTFGLKSNIAILMNKTTSPERAAGAGRAMGISEVGGALASSPLGKDKQEMAG